MKREDFMEYLGTQGDEYDFSVGELEGVRGVFVKNIRFDTETHFSWDAVEESELESLLRTTSHGKNVEQMTRVTGYFSKVGAWNKGKTAELKERSRVDVGA
ncbi:MAG: anaerobic ribonucleoside-triphosphate reductase [Candidatus Thorarchaeota archaeon]